MEVVCPWEAAMEVEWEAVTAVECQWADTAEEAVATGAVSSQQLFNLIIEFPTTMSPQPDTPIPFPSKLGKCDYELSGVP